MIDKLSDTTNRPSILVVDDQAQNIMLIREYLESLDIDIEEANSGMKCLEMQKNKLYTLVILDIQMPGMDGFEVLAQMRKDERLKDIPVVFISAIYDSDKYVLKGIEGGAIDFIVKPLNISILRTKVSNFLKLYEKQSNLDQAVKKLEMMNALLQVNEKKLKRITNSANDSIIVLDSNYKISFWNKTSRKIFGYVKFEITTEDFFDRLISVNSHEILRKYFNSLLQSPKNKSIHTIRITAINKSGIEFPVELSLSYFTTATQALYYTVIIRDISHRVEMEKEALKAKELLESNRLMKEFMDNVSHELRTPMNAILGISNMLLKYNSENLKPKQREGLQIINQSGTRLLDLINDVLDLSRLENNKNKIENETFDLEKQLAILRSMVHSLIGLKNIKFHINKSSNVPEFINTDIKKLNQILINLLGNAVKFTPSGRINLFIHLLNENLHFEVSDTGVGIAGENLSIIFERFKQIDNSASKEYKGTGLGLHICKKLIELMGGEIDAESTLGVGTTIKFYIKIDNKGIQKQSDIEVKNQMAEPMDSQVRVLTYESPLAIIIEDNEENNYWYSNLLKENGYETISCYSSSSAFSTVVKIIPELIVLKYEMPKIHGHFLLNQIGHHINLRNIPLIVSTSEQSLSIKSISNPITLLHEPVNEKQFVSQLKTLKAVALKKHETRTLVLFEKENNIKKYTSETIECLNTEKEETVQIILARRHIHNLVLDGMDIDSGNFKIVKWLQSHHNFIPDQVIVVISKALHESSLKELKNLSVYSVIELNSMNDNAIIKNILC